MLTLVLHIAAFFEDQIHKCLSSLHNRLKHREGQFKALQCLLKECNCKLNAFLSTKVRI